MAGSYDREGYLQIYDRGSGDVVHEMLTMEGSGFQDLAVSPSKVVALLTIHHKLLSCKALVLNALNGDLLSEQTFVDVLHLRLVCDRALVLVNNQVGDFRTRISVFDLNGDASDVFGRSERVAFQYEHNYWKLPICLDEGAVIHTSEDKAELVVREYDHFFK